MADELSSSVGLSLDTNEINVLLDMVSHCIGSHSNFATTMSAKYSRHDQVLNNPSEYRDLMFDIFYKLAHFEEEMTLVFRKPPSPCQ